MRWHAVARQERLHLVEDAPQPLGERAVVGRLQRPLDVVERLEELAQQGLATSVTRRSTSRPARLR